MNKILKPRRKRGVSPRGDFEESKKFAAADSDEKRIADQKKSEVLKALRLSRDGLSTKPPD
jgi:hypothetical protein